MEYVSPVPYDASLLYAGLSLGNYNDAILYGEAMLYNGVASPAEPSPSAEPPPSYGGLAFYPRVVKDDEEAILLLMEML